MSSGETAAPASATTSPVAESTTSSPSTASTSSSALTSRLTLSLSFSALRIAASSLSPAKSSGAADRRPTCAAVRSSSTSTTLRSIVSVTVSPFNSAGNRW